MLKKLYEFNKKKLEFYKKFQTVHTILSFAFIIFWVFAFKSSVLDANNIPSGSMQPTLKIGDFLFVNKMRYSINVPFTSFTLVTMDNPKRGDIVTFIPPANADLPGKTLVKRVIGLPGDKLEVRNNEVYLNGEKFPVLEVGGNSKSKVVGDLDCQPTSCLNDPNGLKLFKEQILEPSTKKVIVEHYILKRSRSFRSDYVFSACGVDASKSLNTFNDDCPPWPNPIPQGKYVVLGDNRDNSSDSRVWGMADRKMIQGKVFLSYFSVNWQLRHDQLGSPVKNPIFLLVETILRKRKGIFVRWNRVFSRIF